ncbi:MULTISPECIES: PEP-CTERM sorting domain-containing protein [Marinobacter]|uniref:PEP-CTERM sorting domain-containing protein n=1 Tax=Marinobacter TaxID=2742 RepID=UPI000DABEC1C|nr:MULTISPECIES: PEP-CTERM sorting domain-containing protein [Marinobacter]
MAKLYVLAVTLLASGSALATRYEDPVVSVPEPSTLGLMATAGVAIYLINRFKK